MVPRTPLELPEIASIVAGYSKKHDVVQSLRVCKSWYQSLLPCLWKDVITNNMSEPIPAVLWPHRQFIVSISFGTIQCQAPALYFHFPILQRLTLQHACFHSAKKLVELNPKLDYLELNGSCEEIPTGFWETAAAKLIHLNHLVLRFIHLPIDQSDAIWRVCTRLETLTLDDCTLPENFPAAVPPGGFPRLGRLIVDLEKEEDYESQLNCLLLHCPQLEALTWTTTSFSDSRTTRFAEMAAQGTWPKLQELTLNNDFSDTVLASIVSNMKRAIGLGFTFSRFSDQAFDALRNHFNTLTHLDITHCAFTTTAMIRDIFCSCQVLRSLSVGGTLAKDVVEGNPWVCLSLRVLNIRFVISEHYLIQLIFERLASLVQLEELHFNDYYCAEAFTHSIILDFRLDSGLGLLDTLRRLRRLKLVGISDREQQFGVEEAEWMVNNWRRLETIELHQRTTIVHNTEVMSIFQAHDVKIV